MMQNRRERGRIPCCVAGVNETSLSSDGSGEGLLESTLYTMVDKHSQFARIVMILFITALAGCFSVGQVIQTGPDTYSITSRGEDVEVSENMPRRIDGQTVARGQSFVTSMHKCKEQDKEFSFISGEFLRRDGLGTKDVPYVYFYTLKFRCDKIVQADP